MALSLLAGISIVISYPNAWPWLPGVFGIVLLYWSGIRWRQDRLAALIGAVLLASGMAGLAVTDPRTDPSAGLVVSALLLTACNYAVLSHFLFIPAPAIRLSAIGAALLALGIALLLTLPTLVPAAILLSAWAALAASLVGIERLWRRWISKPRTRRTSLSAIVVCFNEADRIARCLEPLAGWADEIVVLDSGSNDGTQEIARRYTEKVFTADWQGYGRQKQRALEKCTGEWVINLDADEYIDPDLKREVDTWLDSSHRYSAFRICWVSIIFGKPVFFGADGRYHKRLFRREHARFNDAQVHEDIVVDGTIARMAAPVVHATFRDYGHLKSKQATYAMISANHIEDRHGNPGPVSAVLRGIIAFMLLYLRRLGILDGRRGLLMAAVYAIYTFDKYAAAWSNSQRVKNPARATGDHRI